MRTSGHVIGAFATVATLRSVIFNSEGLEFVFVLRGSASSTSSAQKDEAATAPAPFRKLRRPMPLDGFVIEVHHPSGAKLITNWFSASDVLAYRLRIGFSVPDHAGLDRCRSIFTSPSSTSSASNRRAHESLLRFR